MLYCICYLSQEVNVNAVTLYVIYVYFQVVKEKPYYKANNTLMFLDFVIFFLGHAFDKKFIILM